MRLYTLGSIYIMKFAIDLSPRSRYYSGEREISLLLLHRRKRNITRID